MDLHRVRSRIREMIMAFTQRFALDHGEWVCAGCGARMTEGAADHAVEMAHGEGCPEVSGARAQQA